jgi:wyosine [tRNA(Phe)-imidazoG37] synthetase (radical SAM superfamily)
MIAFGPIPSRRLGRSLGINNIPPKVCTYSCVYCQVGRTLKMETEPRPFYEPAELLSQVRTKAEEAEGAGERIDYLTFVPDGEPTLDANLGQEIDGLRPMGIKIAVISNGSLVWREDVRAALMKADWVSLKVDSLVPKVWRKINRPHRNLKLETVLDGITTFAASFSGELATETMLVKGVNDTERDAEQVADFLSTLDADKVYISIPTRPPAEKSVLPPAEDAINRFYQVLSRRLKHVEYLIGYEGNAFASTGDIEQDLLSITAVHPMREEAVQELLDRARSDWSVVDALVSHGQLTITEYEGNTYFMRSLPERSRA